MSTLTVSLVIEPPIDEPVGIYSPARGVFAFDEFAKALGAALGTTVEIIEAPLSATPRDGLILLYRQGGSLWEYLAAAPDAKKAAERLFLLDVSRQSLPDLLEDYGFAGALETYRYFCWQHRRDSDAGGQIYGRLDVVERLGGVIEGPPFSGPTYCLFDLPGIADLPIALAKYLVEYWNTIAHAPTSSS